MAEPYLKGDNQYIYTNVPYCEFYIPGDYFTTGKVAVNNGATVFTLGIFNVGIFNNGQLKEMKLFRYSTWVDLYSPDTEMRKVQFAWSKEPVQCLVIKYHKGSKVMNRNVVQNSDHLVNFLALLNGGKVPKCLKYSDIITAWWQNQDINNANLGVPSSILELILSTECRNPNKPADKFAVVATGKDDTEYSYMPMSIRDICRVTSTFNALTFEDKNMMITTALNRTHDKAPERESPVEKIIKM